MGLKGRITPETGFSMPADAPLFTRPPYHYKKTTLIAFEFATDPEAAATVLPAALELPDQGAVAGLAFASYPWSTIGAYDEVVVYVHALYQGQPVQYPVVLYVTTDAAMAAGREMGGFPKKLGAISIRYDRYYSATLERPAGVPLCSAVFRPEVSQGTIPPGQPKQLQYISMRLIPSPVDDAPPSLAELIPTTWSLTAGETWTGTGSFEMAGVTALDPMGRLPVRAQLGCFAILDAEMTIDQIHGQEPASLL